MCSPIDKYAGSILDAADRPLFEEAAKAMSVGALRAAYVMVWLSCAESLKRRFREAAIRDGAAGRIVGDIEDKESKQQAVDKMLIERARKYGFISESAKLQLLHIYSMRNVYGHPYEEAPKEEQVVDAASTVVEHVLSQPVKLRHGFGNQLLHSLLNDPHYLDDTDEAVSTFAVEILPRVDEDIYEWFFRKYWKELEANVDDSSMLLFRRRGVFFSRVLLQISSCGFLDDAGWHTIVREFPMISVLVFSKAEVFKMISDRTQDCIVGEVIGRSVAKPGLLQLLSRLFDSGILSTRQSERLISLIDSMNPDRLSAAHLPLILCYKRVISALQYHHWVTHQNPTISYIINQGPGAVAQLNTDEQVLLGRNIYQTAEGGARTAISFIKNLGQNGVSWPLDLVRGMLYECFVNERNELRVKQDAISPLLAHIDSLGSTINTQLADEIAFMVKNSTEKPGTFLKADLEEVVKTISQFPWAASLESEINDWIAKQ